MIGDDIAQALPVLRAQAASLMTSTAVVTRSSGETVWDESSETMQPVVEDVWSGPARLIRAGAGATLGEVAGETIAATPYVVCIPYDTEAEFRDGDLVEVDGLRLRIEAVRYGTHRVEVRLGCTEYR